MKNRKSNRPKDDRVPMFDVEPIKAQTYEALKPLDEVALQMEAKWGIEVLPSLVSPELAQRFELARQQLDEAIRDNNAELAAQKASALIRGWKALDAEATANGHKADPDNVWYVEQDDFAIAIVKSRVDEKAVAEGHRIFHIDEVVRLIAATYKEVYDTKKIFPGAKVETVKKSGDMNDEIPF